MGPGMQEKSGTMAAFGQPTRGARRLFIRAGTALVLVTLALTVGGCGGFTQSYQRGYVLPEGALEQIPLGSSQEQVLIVLGTPSTVATVSGETFYYISQQTEQTAFLPQEEVKRRVIAIYFDKDRKVRRIADYGIRDGKIFDAVSRTTPSGGEELSYIRYLIRAFQLN